MHTNRCVFREDKARAFRSAVGVLNTMYPAEIAGVNRKLFQAAGSGAAVLTEFRPTVPDLFAVNDEVLVFHDFDDLVDQAARLFDEPGLTARLGDAAARRAHRDHTYDLRLTTILEKNRDYSVCRGWAAQAGKPTMHGAGLGFAAAALVLLGGARSSLTDPCKLLSSGVWLWPHT